MPASRRYPLGMTGTTELRRARWLLATIAVVLAAGVGIGRADVGQVGTQSSGAIQSIGVVHSGTSGLFDSRSTRNIDAGKLHRPFDHEGVTNAESGHSRSLPWVQAQAGVLERADHPERLGRILLRGPPGPSA